MISLQQSITKKNAATQLVSQGMSRKNAIAAFSAGAAAMLGAAAVPAAVFAAEEAAAPAAAAPETTADGVPKDWGLTKQYYPVSRRAFFLSGVVPHLCTETSVALFRRRHAFSGGVIYYCS